MDFPRIPVENWSKRELYEAIDEFASGNKPLGEDPPQKMVDVIREMSSRGLEIEWEKWTKIVDVLRTDPRFGMIPK